MMMMMSVETEDGDDAQGATPLGRSDFCEL